MPAHLALDQKMLLHDSPLGKVGLGGGGWTCNQGALLNGIWHQTSLPKVEMRKKTLCNVAILGGFGGGLKPTLHFPKVISPLVLLFLHSNSSTSISNMAL